MINMHYANSEVCTVVYGLKNHYANSEVCTVVYGLKNLSERARFLYRDQNNHVMQLLSNTLLVKMCGVRVCFCAVICAFLFFEAANATTCSNATQVVFMTGNCYAQLTTLGDRAVCNRTSQCGVVFGNVTTNCNSSVSQETLRTIINYH